MADTNLVCTVCGRESTTSFASSLKSGWETCCGYTMHLVTTSANIGDAVTAAMGNAKHIIRKADS